MSLFLFFVALRLKHQYANADCSLLFNKVVWQRDWGVVEYAVITSVFAQIIAECVSERILIFDEVMKEKLHCDLPFLTMAN